jgi:hypothetical protein
LSDNSVGIVVEQRFGLRTYEDGLGLGLGVRLSHVPDDDVEISVGVDVPDNLQLSAPSLRFTRDNWFQPQWLRVDVVGEVTATSTRRELRLGAPQSNDMRTDAPQITPPRLKVKRHADQGLERGLCDLRGRDDLTGIYGIEHIDAVSDLGRMSMRCVANQ